MPFTPWSVPYPKKTGLQPPTTILSQPTASEPLPIIALLDTCLRQAYTEHASDIHLEPNEHGLRVRFRIDGILTDAPSLKTSVHNELIARIKILAHLRTDEHQAAQDGRFRHTIDGKDIDVRVSIAPTHHGENAVLRLLAEHAATRTLSTLGLSAANQAALESALSSPSGLILATGPTGSGKTSTLYTLMKELNHAHISIVTIEDPIEYAIAGVTQIQINPRSQLTFANGLRTILRQDPNVIMVGEIRDAETASIAINTALTGHLILSTLHTNDAATTLPRLLDMGIDAYLVASTVTLAIGQRLVRKICPSCRVTHTLTPAETQSFERRFSTTSLAVVQKPLTFFKGQGCAACSHTGYCGRIGIYEVLVMSPAIKEAIHSRASAPAIKAIAISEGMVPMLEDGLMKAHAGETSLSEVLRTIGPT